VAFIGLACGTIDAAVRTVNMDDNFFSPLITSISVGDTVRWVNQGFNPHSTTSNSGVWDSEDDFPGGMDNGDTFDFTFNSAGDFPYHDSGFSGMTGLVRVVSANAPPTCSITNWMNGAMFVAPTNLVISASAVDMDGSVASVQFFLGTNSAGISTVSPYSVVTNGLSDGEHVLTAVATDNLGARGTSAPVSITVTVPIRFDPHRLRVGSNTLVLTISATPGLRYALDGSTSVFPSNWVAIKTNTAASNSVTFSNATGGFFRARLVPDP
jgi:plastocyanin